MKVVLFVLILLLGCEQPKDFNTEKRHVRKGVRVSPGSLLVPINTRRVGNVKYATQFRIIPADSVELYYKSLPGYGKDTIESEPIHSILTRRDSIRIILVGYQNKY